MEEKQSADALAWKVTWRTVRQMFAGLGWGGLGALALILSDALPRGWKPAAVAALTALLQVRMILRGVRSIRENWRAHQSVWDELRPLMLLEGFTVELRRTELKKLEDAYFSAVITQFIPMALGLFVLYQCVLILPRLGIGFPPIFPQ